MSKKIEKQYTIEFKQSSAQLAVESEQSIAQTARDLGINENTLHGWIRKYVTGQENAGKSQISASSLYEENKSLKRENARLKQECEILKKATAYFARGV